MSPSTRKRSAKRCQLFLENKKGSGPPTGDLEKAPSAAAPSARVKACDSHLDKELEADEKEREEAGSALVLETVNNSTECPDPT